MVDFLKKINKYFHDLEMTTMHNFNIDKTFERNKFQFAKT